MDELQAGVKFAFAILPQPPVLLQPGKAALDHPALWNDGKCVQRVALGDLHRGLEQVRDRLCKRPAHVAAIGQHTPVPNESGLAPLHGLQGTLAIGHLGRRHSDRMGQAPAIHGNVTLDPRDLLACIVALAFGAIGVLHALRVHDQERRAGVAPLFHACCATLIFLQPAPAR